MTINALSPSRLRQPLGEQAVLRDFRKSSPTAMAHVTKLLQLGLASWRPRGPHLPGKAEDLLVRLGSWHGQRCFTFRYASCQDDERSFQSMSTTLVLELLGGFLAACVALAFVTRGAPSPARHLKRWASSTIPVLRAYVLTPGSVSSVGLLLLRLSIGVMMIHHGQEKLADPSQFASTYVASLHLPFPLFFAYVAGFSELIGSWLVMFGLLTPLGALALTGTMAVAAYQHISTAGLNIYVLELVALYLGGSLALLLVGPGRFSFDAGILSAFRTADGALDGDGEAVVGDGLRPAYVTVETDPSRGF
jgi:putative oxidoreductase